MSQIREFFRSRFSKQGDVRFTSHHDLMRLYERAFRRAQMPLAMSQGYNPRPRISLPAPLSVGFTGENEVLDFELCRWTRPAEVKNRLAKELPEGVELISLRTLPTKPGRRPSYFSYRVPLLDGHPVTTESLNELMNRPELVVERRRKKEVETKDVTNIVRSLRLDGNDLHMLFAMTERGTTRPEEILRELQCERGRHYLQSSIVRTHVDLSSSL